MISLAARYRGSGADFPYGDPGRAHGVAMEGYFWRITDPASGRVVVALNGVNRDRDGATWSTLGLVARPSGFLRTTAYPVGLAQTERLGVRSGTAFVGDSRALDVDLGPDATLDVRFDDLVPWPRLRWGGSSVFQMIPSLNQYWHPWLLGGRATGTARLGAETWHFDGAQVYAEKNWGKGGFPDSWWWGQAHGFEEPTACVAFAGGEVAAGPLRTTVTALVVLLPDGRLVRLGDPLVSPVRAEVTDETWVLRGRGFGWRVDVEAEAPLEEAHVLPVPLPFERRNVAGALEQLGGRLAISVRRGSRLVWRAETLLAGLEHGGLDRAAAELRRRGAPAGATDSPPGLC